MGPGMERGWLILELSSSRSGLSWSRSQASCIYVNYLRQNLPFGGQNGCYHILDALRSNGKKGTECHWGGRQAVKMTMILTPPHPSIPLFIPLAENTLSYWLSAWQVGWRREGGD